MSQILHVEAPSVNSEVPIDLVSEADRQWWARVSSSEWWHDLAVDRVADAYGDPDPFDDDARDEGEVAFFFRSRPHDRPHPGDDVPDEFTRWNGHPG